MTESIEDDAKDARVDWLLSERLGGETPPDLEQDVLAKLQTEPAPAQQRGANRLLVAAFVLIGVAAVVAVSQMSGAPSKAVAKPQQGDSKFVTWSDNPALVRSRADIEKLPKDTKQVFGINLDDDALPALLRLRELEAIALTVSTFEALRGGPLKPKDAPVFFSDDGIALLASLPSLRAVVLEGQLELKGPGLVRLVKDTGLRELTLTSMAISDEMLVDLARLPLQALRLHGSQEFGDAGLTAIGRSATLTEVSLRGCTHVDDDWVAKLAGMPALQTLNLSGIGSHTIFSGIRLSPLPEPTPGSGVTDRLLGKLAPLPQLRKLDLSSGDISDKGLVHLKKFPSLRHLTLRSIGTISAAGIDSLPPDVASLNIVGHPNLDQQMLEIILARKKLTDLDLGWCRKRTPDAIEQLTKATHLKTLNVDGWQLDEADRKRLAHLPAKINFGKP